MWHFYYKIVLLFCVISNTSDLYVTQNMYISMQHLSLSKKMLSIYINWLMDVLKFCEKHQENTKNANTGTQWLKDRGVTSSWHLVNHNCRKVYDITSPSASPISCGGWFSSPVISVHYKIILICYFTADVQTSKGSLHHVNQIQRRMSFRCFAVQLFPFICIFSGTFFFAASG